MEDFDFSKYYSSLSVQYRMEEQFLVEKAMEEGVPLESIRYDVTNGSLHGVMKSLEGDLYHFNYFPYKDSFRMVLIEDQDNLRNANYVFNKSNNGCDLIKAEGKGQSKGTAGGSQGVSGVMPVEEEDDIEAQQEELLTDRHPGAAMGTTPDRPEVGRQWHEEEEPVIMTKSWNATTLMQGLQDSLKKSTSVLQRPISDKERQFMIEVLGRTPNQVAMGDVYLNPTQKVIYQQWLSKSVRSSAQNLEEWLNKKRGR